MALTCKLSELVDSIRATMVPDWVREYMRFNKESVIQDLRNNGKHVINGPNGVSITVEAK